VLGFAALDAVFSPRLERGHGDRCRSPRRRQAWAEPRWRNGSLVLPGLDFRKDEELIITGVFGDDAFDPREERHHEA
jgi:hypothetical protein